MHGKSVRAFVITMLAAAGAPSFAAAADGAETTSPVDTQRSQGPGQGAAPDDGVLGEVVVTARHREESSQNVPIALTALSGAMLESRGVQSIADAAQFAPNVSFDPGTGRAGGATAASVFIRGIGQNDFLATSDPGVGLYVDDVYYGRSAGGVLDALDLDHVEILRGPQGTLFGRNTIGGAITLTSQAPTNSNEGYVEGQLGRFNEHNVKAMINVPITDDLAVRVSGSLRQRDGYTDSGAQQHLDLNDVNDVAARAVARWTPNSILTSTLIVDTSSQRRDGAGYSVIAVNPKVAAINLFNQYVVPGTGRAPIGPAYYGNAETDYSTDTVLGSLVSNLNTYGVSLKNEVALTDDITLTSISAFRNLKSYSVIDDDGMPFDYGVSKVDERQDQFSQEFRLNGRAFDHRLTYVGGLYYFHEHDNQFLDLPLYYGLYQASGLSAYSLSTQADLDITNKSYAAYGDATFAVTSKINLSAGLRYTYEQKDVIGASEFYLTDKVILPPGSELSPTFNSVTPRGAIDFHPFEHVLLYGSVTEGYKSGGVNGSIFARASDFTVYKPEKSTTYEVGFKANLLDNRLTFHGDVFSNNYKSIQEKATLTAGQFGCPTTCKFIINDVQARVDGVEFEGVATPVEHLSVSFGGGYMNQKFTYIDPVLITAKVLNYSYQLPMTPKYSANVGVQYDMTLPASLRLTPRLDYTFRSKTYTTITNDPYTTQGEYGLLNARMTLRRSGAPWELSLAVFNATNKTYIVTPNDGYASNGYSAAVFGAPRTWTAGLRYSF